VARDSPMTVTLGVLPFDEQQYCVSAVEEGPKKESSHYRAYASTVGGASLLNVQDLDARKPAAERKWFFVRYALLKPDVLDLQVVDERLWKGKDASPAAVRQIIERNLDNRELFSDLYVCARIAEE
jgi:hypothetical protein